MFYIYFHINPITKEVFYVGKGYANRAYEVNKHRRSNFWNNIVNKYGEPIIVIVKDNISEKYAFLLEKAYIKIFGRRDLNEGTLVNMTNGGDGLAGLIFTEIHKEKISISSKGNTKWLGKKHSDETKQKISKLQKGNTNMLGKKHSD